MHGDGCGVPARPCSPCVLQNVTMALYALAPLPVTKEQTIYYNRAGLVFPAPLVFDVPLLCASHSVHVERRSYFILVDITANDVLQWQVYIPHTKEFLHPLAGQVTTVRVLQARSHETFLRYLLVRQDQGWLPWSLCNPFNLCGITVRGDTRTVFPAGGGQQLAVKQLNRHFQTTVWPTLSMPVPRSLYPMEINFLVRADLETIVQRRKAAQQEAMDAAAAHVLPPDDLDVTPLMLRTDVIADLPDNIDDIIVTDQDHLVNPREWNYDTLLRLGTAEAMRKFLLHIFHHFARKDFRLPKLLSICALGTSSQNSTGLCCVFDDIQEWVWVNMDNLTHTVLMACEKMAVPQTAFNVQKDYLYQVNRFTMCKDRPKSPFAWTETEEYAASEALPKKPDDDDDDQRQMCLREYAAQDIAARDDILQLTDMEVEEAKAVRYEQLLREDVLYRKKHPKERLAAGRPTDTAVGRRKESAPPNNPRSHPTDSATSRRDRSRPKPGRHAKKSRD